MSDTVLDALSKIVGWSRDALRRAGEMPAAGGPTAPSSTETVFARTAPADAEAPASAARAEPPAEEWDEVDRLFRGGP